MGTTPARPAGVRLEGGPLLVVGEVVTAFLQNSTPLTTSTCWEILRSRPGSTVRAGTRPVQFAISPATAVGVHCELPTGSGARAEGVGTIVGQTTVTGGSLVQASARAVLSARAFGYRDPWSYYLANPGLIEVRGKADVDDLVRGLVDGEQPGTLDLGAVCSRLLDRVQRSPLLDRRPGLRARRIRLRWVARLSSAAGTPSTASTASAAGPAPGTEVGFAPVDEGAPWIEFIVHDEISRSLVVGPTAAEAGLCLFAEDVARHDWLLSTLLRFVDEQRSSPRAEVVSGPGLASLVDLFQLWMPGARVPPEFGQVWAELEAGTSFTRQWLNLVDHVRDQIALASAACVPRGPRLSAAEARLS